MRGMTLGNSLLPRSWSFLLFYIQSNFGVFGFSGCIFLFYESSQCSDFADLQDSDLWSLKLCQNLMNAIHLHGGGSCYLYIRYFTISLNSILNRTSNIFGTSIVWYENNKYSKVVNIFSCSIHTGCPKKIV